MIPFIYGFTSPVKTLDGYIPKVSTLDVSENTTAVALSVCPKVWKQLPCEGVIVLEVRQTPSTASASLPVFISINGILSTTPNKCNLSLVNASGAAITGSQVTAGNRYIAYYNKCENTVQLMNYTPVSAAA